MQTLVLVVLDATSGPKRPLGYLVGSLIPVVEALLVVVGSATVLAVAALPASTTSAASARRRSSPSCCGSAASGRSRVRTWTDWTIGCGQPPRPCGTPRDHTGERPPFSARSTGSSSASSPQPRW